MSVVSAVQLCDALYHLILQEVNQQQMGADEKWRPVELNRGLHFQGHHLDKITPKYNTTVKCGILRSKNGFKNIFV